VVSPKVTPLALMVLELLAEDDFHPYEMRQLLLSRRRELRVKITPGSLYRTVERLAEDGLISVVETSRAGKRPERTVYSLTEAGLDAYTQRLREMLAVPADEYPQFPPALACMHSLSKEDAVAQLSQRRMLLEALVAAHDVIIEQLHKKDIEPIVWIDVQYEQAVRRAELAWVGQLVDDLQSGMVSWLEGERK
jgi:DNA-binding PadR family transcriptional regulator